MVSFQCHNCGDVVKKPKLDQHRTRCHGGFDCIDCSTTFNSPAEYKGHTSCISEAEKYQKGLYKGPKMGESAPKNNYPPQPTSGPYPGGGSSWSRGAFRGGRGGRGGNSSRGGWGQRPSRGTGANDTPLGTPNRMSPVTQSTPAPVKEVPIVESSNDSCKSKKRKFMGSEDVVPSNGDTSSHKKTKIAEQANVQHLEPASVPLTTTQYEAEFKKKKMPKKKKKFPSMTEEVGEKEGKKRKMKEAVPADIVENDSERAERPGKKEKTEHKESDEAERKRKKEKRKDKEGAVADGEDTQQNSVDLDSKKERKKSKKKGKEDTESAVSKDGPHESSIKKGKKGKERERDEILAGEYPKHADEDVDAKETKKKKKKEKKALEDTINTDSISTSGEVKKKKSKKSLVTELGT